MNPKTERNPKGAGRPKGSLNRKGRMEVRKSVRITPYETISVRLTGDKAEGLKEIVEWYQSMNENMSESDVLRIFEGVARIFPDSILAMAEIVNTIKSLPRDDYRVIVGVRLIRHLLEAHVAVAGSMGNPFFDRTASKICDMPEHRINT